MAACGVQRQQFLATSFRNEIGSIYAGIVHLDISNTLCLNSHLALAVKLQHLITLTANNCRKLTPSLSSVLFSQPEGRLRHVCLQRCFQLTHDTLNCGLQSSRTDRSTIKTLTFSHLDVSEVSWVGSSPHAAALYPSSPVSSLDTLALNNCEGLSPSFFRSLASLAPNLKSLMLGGCIISSQAFIRSKYPAPPNHRSSDANSGPVHATITPAPNAAALSFTVTEPAAIPRFESVLALVCRVREDMLSRAGAAMPFPAFKDDPNDATTGSPPKYDLIIMFF